MKLVSFNHSIRNIIVIGLSILWTAVALAQTPIPNVNKYADVERSPNGTMLAAVGQGGIAKIYDLNNGATIYEFEVNSSGLLAVTWSPDNRKIAASGWDKYIYIWCVDRDSTPECIPGRLLTSFVAHDPFVFDVDWSPDGAFLASVNQHDQTLRVWSASTYQLINTYRGGDPIMVDWNYSSTQLAISDLAGNAWVIDASLNPASVNVIEVTPSIAPANAVSWSPNQDLLAVGRGNLLQGAGLGSVDIWDVTTETVITSFGNIGGSIVTLEWDPYGSRLAGFSTDRNIRVWDIDNEQLLTTIPLNPQFPSSSGGITWDASGQNVIFGGSEIALPLGLPTPIPTSTPIPPTATYTNTPIPRH